MQLLSLLDSVAAYHPVQSSKAVSVLTMHLQHCKLHAHTYCYAGKDKYSLYSLAFDNREESSTLSNTGPMLTDTVLMMEMIFL